MITVTKSLFFDSVKGFLCGALISTLSVCTVMSVSAAAYTTGAESVMSPPNRTYYAYNTLATGKEYGQKYARGFTHVYTNDNMPGGYMGVRPAVYDENDNALMVGSWTYSPNNISDYSNVAAVFSISGNPAVYSQGRARVWNTQINDYWTYATFRTPFLNDYT